MVSYGNTKQKFYCQKVVLIVTGITNPGTVAASIECSRTLNYRSLKRGESNLGSRLCSRYKNVVEGLIPAIPLALPASEDFESEDFEPVQNKS